MVERDANLKVENLFDLGYIGVIGLNNLYPPFDNQKLRQSMLYLVKQEDMLLPTFADPKWFNACASWFTCGSDMENDANTGWFKGGQNLPRARELMQEGGYDGRPVIILQAVDVPTFSNAALVLPRRCVRSATMRRPSPMDCRHHGAAPRQHGPAGQGWLEHLLRLGAGGMSLSNPYMSKGKATNGKAGWFGWPTDAKNEELRAQWIAADTEEQRKQIARQIQDNIWTVVPKLFFGQWRQPVAYRKNTSGWLHVPEVIPFWNVAKA